METAVIELVFCPPYSAIVPEDQAKEWAKHRARKAGFTHYRMSTSEQIEALT